MEYEDDQVKVHVTASEEGIIPDHASLKVVPLVKQEVTNEMTDEQKQEVEAINKKYDEAEKKLTEKAMISPVSWLTIFHWLMQMATRLSRMVMSKSQWITSSL